MSLCQGVAACPARFSRELVRSSLAQLDSMRDGSVLNQMLGQSSAHCTQVRMASRPALPALLPRLPLTILRAVGYAEVTWNLSLAPMAVLLGEKMRAATEGN